MTTGMNISVLRRRPKLLELHERHLGLVGKVDVPAEVVREPEWLATLSGSIDVFRSCGPMHERGGWTASERLHSKVVPPSSESQEEMHAATKVLPPTPLLEAHTKLTEAPDLVGAPESKVKAAADFDARHAKFRAQMESTLVTLHRGIPWLPIAVPKLNAHLLPQRFRRACIPQSRHFARA